MSHTLQVARLPEVFQSIEENWEKLTQWEQNFVESVQDQLERHELSERQLEVLEKIYLKV